jgi:enoyl-CoA hydratase/carnithine racemase
MSADVAPPRDAAAGAADDSSAADAAGAAQTPGPPTLHVQGAVARIVLRRPAQANRLEAGDLAVFAGHVATVDADAAVRVLRIEAGGRHFCSGFDIGGLTASRPAEFGAMVDALAAARPVTIACIQGGVHGGATDLALACDFRVGSTRCEMAMPAARLGLHFYASGLERFVTRLGLNAAKRLFLAGEPLAAPEMHAVGFLTHCVAPDALPAAVDELTARVCGMAPLALMGMKRHLDAIAAGQLDAAALQSDFEASLRSDDLREGLAAWAERRAPRFTGR